MIDGIIADLDKESTVAEAEDKNAQADYEKTMSDAAAKRAKDTKSIADKTSAKADTEALLENSAEDKKAAGKELAATLQTIQGLHGECDWLLKYFDVRKEARTDEMDSLNKAKDVLHGADYAFPQETSLHRKH